MPEADAAPTDFASVSLARAVEVPIPQADVLAGRFPPAASPSSLAKDEWTMVLRSLHFGSAFTDHIVRAHWRQDEGWDDYGVIPCGSLSLSPTIAVLHYGQEVLEGIRTYRHEGRPVQTLRPRYSAARLNVSARRVALPELAEEDSMASLVNLVRADATWVPSGEGESLYLCPFAFTSETFLGMCPVTVVDYYVIASLIGSCFSHGLESVSIWVAIEYHYTRRGGTGVAKTGGNYAPSLLPQQEAYTQGCDQVYFFDDVPQRNIEGLGDMSLTVIDADGTVCTPRLTGAIPEGCTRSAIICLLCNSGRNVMEETISLQGLFIDIESGRVSEVFACGAAAVIVPPGRLKGEGFGACIEGNEVTRQIHDRLTAIQINRTRDSYGWMYQFVPPRS